jgi:hypothetical protein
MEEELNKTLEEDNASTISGNPTISRSDLIRNMVLYATKLGTEELADFVSRIGSAEEIVSTPDQNYASVQNAIANDGTANKNKSSINSANAPGESMKQLAKEDLSIVFGDSKDLTEEFKEKLSTIFEAALITRLEIEKVKIEEEVIAEAEIAIAELQEEMKQNIDSYINYAVAEWISENKLAINNNIKTEMTESFLSGLKSLFEEHYIDIPENKVDVIESLTLRIEELEETVNNTIEENIELTKIVNKNEVTSIVNDISEDLSDSQKEKFTKLIEDIGYSSVDEFKNKANIIKETYFKNKSKIVVNSDRLLNESVDEPESSKHVDPTMAVYVDSLSRSIKK